MPTNESLRETLNYFKQQRDRKLQEARNFDLTIQQLERELGEAPSTAEIVVNAGDSLPSMTERVDIVMNGKKPEIRPDEFFGMTQGEAARKYLKRVGHAVSFEELVEALQAGGCKVGGENPKRVLYISLVRNTRDFVPPRQGYIGLREFYPGVAKPKEKSERNPRRRTRPAKARSADKRRGKTPKKEIKAKSPKAAKKEPSQLVAAVRSILSDKHPHSIDEIVAGVTAKLGQPVRKIGVFGALRNKESFEQVDGKYRLVN